MLVDRRKLITATLLGVSIAVIKGPFQWPITDLLILVEAPILGLSFLILGRGGGTYAGLVNGALQSVVKANFFPLDLIFGISYGLLVDVFGTVLNVRGETTSVRRMTLALGLASTITGLSIAFAVITLNVNLGPSISAFTPSQLINVVYIPIIIWGIFSGALGGFISARLWDRNLRSRFKSMPTGPS